MSKKNVELILQPREPHYVGDGFRVHNFIPSGYGMSMQRMDPFILLDYNSKFYFPPSDHQRGVDVHPHRGFETVTIAYEGRIAHHDSFGGGGIIGEGDVQWMTAASGLLHKEYHEKEFSQKGGDFQMVQLWVNLPAKYKMSKPKYQAITKSEMGIKEIEGGRIEVIAGEYKGIKGPASTFTPIHMSNLTLQGGHEVEFEFPAHYNTVLLVIEGKIGVNGEESVQVNNMARMANDGEKFTISALEDAKVLVLSGEPIGEPIAAQGPFVMNTRDELAQAVRDFHNGEFGVLESGAKF